MTKRWIQFIFVDKEFDIYLHTVNASM